MNKIIVQIYEVQTPSEAEKLMELGVDHIGSVVVSQEVWKLPLIRDTINMIDGSAARSSLIPLFSSLDAVLRTLDYYKPDIVHFCEDLTFQNGGWGTCEELILLQENVKKRFPGIKIMRSIPISQPGMNDHVATIELARLFEPVSDYFLTDTLLVKESGSSFDHQPVKGFVGITGQTCDWDIAAKLVESSRIPVILAGGMGTRLFPLTKVTNKHLLPVGKEPMIYHPVKQLVGAGIKEILVVTSTDHMGDVVNLLGSGKGFGCEFTYKVQEDALGIAHALALAENFVAGNRVAVLLGDNIFERTIEPYVERFRKQERGARVLLKSVNDPERFGVAALDEYHVISIEEKPEQPKSNYAVTGLYMYNGQVFDVIKTLKPSQRGELEITDVNNFYIKQETVTYEVVKGFWSDAGTFESLFRATNLIERKISSK